MLFIVVFEVERVVFFVVQVSVAVDVVGAVGVTLFGSPGVVIVERFVLVCVFVVTVTGGVVESSPEQLFGGCEAVVRFEVLQVALHDVDEEADGVFPVGGFQFDEVCELLVQGGAAESG